jgi:hypothetical protein
MNPASERRFLRSTADSPDACLNRIRRALDSAF